jgi:predicted hotdog family 3-hydroxylacyl-ACP dehydratase
MPIDVGGLIPHRGTMCLLDSVDRWNEEEILCRATSHRRVDHPLRDPAGLRGLSAIEYGAQAIAAHVGLLKRAACSEPSIGWLVAARDVEVFVPLLNQLDSILTVRARVVLTQDAGAVYDVTVTAGAQQVMTGRLSVMMDRSTMQP